MEVRCTQGPGSPGRSTLPLRGLYPEGHYFTAASASTDHSHVFETHSSLCSENRRLPWFSSCLIGYSCSASNAGSSSLHQISDWLCPHPNESVLCSLSHNLHSSQVTSRHTVQIWMQMINAAGSLARSPPTGPAFCLLHKVTWIAMGMGVASLW